MTRTKLITSLCFQATKKQIKHLTVLCSMGHNSYADLTVHKEIPTRIFLGVGRRDHCRSRQLVPWQSFIHRNEV